MDKIIGSTTTTSHGTEHPYLVGYKIKIVAVLKGGADPAVDPDDVQILRSDEEIAAAGGVQVTDRVEVVPFLESEGRFSFVTSDPRACDLECFAHLTKER